MIVCRVCGRRNPNGTEFCANCGEYLEFEGDQVKTTTFQAADSGGGPPTAAAPPPAPALRTPAPNVAPEPVPAAPGTAASSAARPPAKRRGDETEPAGEVVDPAVAERARRLLAKAPAAVQPKARPPEEAQHRPPAVVEQRDPTLVRAGEIACPNCGKGNSPERHFCRRCGTELHPPRPAPVPVPIPVPQPPAPARVEQRPRVPPPTRDDRPWYRRPVPLIGTVLLAVLAVAVLVVLGRILVGAIGGGDGGQAGKGGQAGQAGQEPAAGVPLKPSRVFASSNRGHVANRAIDGDDTTAWPGDVPTEQRPERIWVRFDTPVKVSRVEISSGAPGAEFGRHPRPRHGVLEFSDGTSQSFELQDRAGPQAITFAARRVNQVVVKVTDAYDARPGTKAPITELRLFGPGPG